MELMLRSFCHTGTNWHSTRPFEAQARGWMSRLKACARENEWYGEARRRGKDDRSGHAASTRRRLTGY